MKNIDLFTLARAESGRFDWAFASRASYYIAFSLYSIGAFFQLTSFSEVLGIQKDLFVAVLQDAALLLLIYKFFTGKTSVLGWCVIILAVFIGFLSWQLGDEGYFFWLVLFVVCSDGIEIRRLAQITLCIVASLTIITVVSCNFGIIENRVFRRADTVRYGWGFRHPNYFSAYLLLFCICFSVLRFGKNPLPDMMLICGALVVNLAVLDSRSSAILSIMQMALLFIFYTVKTRRGRRIWSIVFFCGMFLAISLSLYFMIGYDPGNSLHMRLNNLLSLRPSLAHGYYSMQSLTPFGADFSEFEPIYWENGQPAKFIVDNAFAHLVLRSGFISAAFFFSAVAALMINLIINDKWGSLMFGLVLLITYGIGETLGIRIECNFFLVGIGTELLFDRDGAMTFVDVAKLARDKIMIFLRGIRS